MTARLCEEDGCTAAYYAKGLCRKHYDAQPERRAANSAGMARRYATPEGRTVKLAAQARYRTTDKGKASHAAGMARYSATGKGRANALERTERTWLREGLKRAARAGAVIGDVPANTRAILLARFGETCLAEGCDNFATDVDHVIALADGGAHDIDNFQTLCSSCNRSKGTNNTDHRPKEGN